jgi:hypothetical protein
MRNSAGANDGRRLRGQWEIKIQKGLIRDEEFRTKGPMRDEEFRRANERRRIQKGPMSDEELSRGQRWKKNSEGANEGWRIQKRSMREEEFRRDQYSEGAMTDEEFRRGQWGMKNLEGPVREEGFRKDRWGNLSSPGTNEGRRMSDGWNHWGKGESSNHQNRIESIKDEATNHGVVKI